MKIREANEKDMNKIMKIFMEEYKKPPYNENWTEEYARKKLEYYFKGNNIDVAEDENGEIIGFIISSSYCWYDGLRGSVDEIVVSLKFQGTGIGKKLMEKAMGRLKEMGIKKVSLMSSTKSKAFEIYKKWGFEDEEGYVFMIKDL
ncbi:MAG: GNAT family N-acetyltransferase [Nanoarchaeota archaeon]|nr:GNAT family N-acetyltransferase [Nanoarchaeota archaeon]